jgi:hypothetical protein
VQPLTSSSFPRIWVPCTYFISPQFPQIFLSFPHI